MRWLRGGREGPDAPAALAAACDSRLARSPLLKGSEAPRPWLLLFFAAGLFRTPCLLSLLGRSGWQASEELCPVLLLAAVARRCRPPFLGWRSGGQPAWDGTRALLSEPLWLFVCQRWLVIETAGRRAVNFSFGVCDRVWMGIGCFFFLLLAFDLD